MDDDEDNPSIGEQASYSEAHNLIKKRVCVVTTPQTLSSPRRQSG